jgi:hypothetical protein
MLTTKSTYRRCKAQSAFEFIFIFGIFLAALVLAAWVSNTKTTEINLYDKELKVEELLTTVSDKINTAWIEGEGFSTNLTLPETVASSSYEIFVASNLIVLNVSGEVYIKSIITNDVGGTLSIGVNTLRNNGTAVEIM